jgi:hypothetical protein
MQRFIQQHAKDVIGVLSGFDRIIFRGNIRSLAYPEGMMGFLGHRRVLLKDFGTFAEGVTKSVCEWCEAFARERSCPLIYLDSSKEPKEPLARGIAETNNITEGLVCILTCVEPCRSFDIFRNREAKKLELRTRFRRCLHAYFYGFHPEFGFIGVRLQTWFPFQIQVWINGREWLARTLDRAGIRYERSRNCFPWIQDFAAAQELMDLQLKTPWRRSLDEIADFLNPLYRKLLDGTEYYWSLHQSEWATDIAFRSPEALAAIYPALVHHGITRLRSEDVMRFLGHRVHGRFAGQIVSDFRSRPEGVRIKHRVDANSQKLYDKEGSVLRAENTVHCARAFKVFRRKEGDSKGPMEWRPLRKGIADLHRRAQLGQAANERYLDALADADTTTPIGDLLGRLCPPTTLNGQRHRALRPWDANDTALIAAVSDGANILQGFRNRDIRIRLYGDDPSDPKERRRRSGRVSRLLRLLRAHSLIAKIPNSHRYQVTNKGRLVCSILLAAHTITLGHLNNVA